MLGRAGGFPLSSVGVRAGTAGPGGLIPWPGTRSSQQPLELGFHLHQEPGEPNPPGFNGVCTEGKQRTKSENGSSKDTEKRELPRAAGVCQTAVGRVKGRD